jgi:hypothetical protein
MNIIKKQGVYCNIGINEWDMEYQWLLFLMDYQVGES